MSKTWNETRPTRVDRTPQKAIDRLRMQEAQADIKEFLQEATRVQPSAK